MSSWITLGVGDKHYTTSPFCWHDAILRIEENWLEFTKNLQQSLVSPLLFVNEFLPFTKNQQYSLVSFSSESRIQADTVLHSLSQVFNIHSQNHKQCFLSIHSSCFHSYFFTFDQVTHQNSPMCLIYFAFLSRTWSCHKLWSIFTSIWWNVDSPKLSPVSEWLGTLPDVFETM